MASDVVDPLRLSAVRQVELRSLPLAEFLLDSGDTAALEIRGGEPRVSLDGGVLQIEGDAPAGSSATNALQVSGSYVTGNVAAPAVSPGTSPFRLATGGGSVRIRLVLPPGQRVTIRSDSGVFSTAAPMGSDARAAALTSKAAEKREHFLAKAAERRARARARLEEALAAEAAGKSEKAARRRHDAEAAEREAAGYEREAEEVYERLMGDARKLE